MATVRPEGIEPSSTAYQAIALTVVLREGTVGVVGIEPTISWSRTKRDTASLHSEVFFGVSMRRDDWDRTSFLLTPSQARRQYATSR